MTEPSNLPTTTITDSAGRTLVCYLKAEVVVDGTDYGLLTPVDTPVELVKMGKDGAENEGEIAEILEWEDHEDLLSVFDICLDPRGVKVIRSAATLTVAGDVDGDRKPEEDEDGDYEEDDCELLISIKYTDGWRYALAIPLAPFFIAAKPRGFTGELVEYDELHELGWVDPWLSPSDLLSPSDFQSAVDRIRANRQTPGPTAPIPET